uniref:Histidine kinase n=1 Tax=Aureoumbra lagunensis TaxID=44058 RepID=A0A7S3JNC8_9STRA|mmetsp:Transcript_23842/g.31039  ORF Transcript_23842/g.31039 Transcript_23842/m.31039 type:complete len:666 (+) Transcript_23842:133-2130(+)
MDRLNLSDWWDMLTAVAYFAIPIEISVIVLSSSKKRKRSLSLSFVETDQVIFILFALFILSCGINHLCIAVKPSALKYTKPIMSLISLCTAVILFKYSSLVRAIHRYTPVEMRELFKISDFLWGSIDDDKSGELCVVFIDTHGNIKHSIGNSLMFSEHILTNSNLYTFLSYEDCEKLKSATIQSIYQDDPDIENANRVHPEEGTAFFGASVAWSHKPRNIHATPVRLVFHANQNLKTDLEAMILPCANRTSMVITRIADDSAKRRHETAIESVESFQMRVAMMAAFAHDVKTPLTTFQLALDLLKSEVHSEQGEKLLRKAYGSSEVLRLTVLQALEVANSGNISPHPRPFKLSDLMEQFALITEATACMVPVKYLIQSQLLQAEISTDQDWLLQNIVNLFTNAAKHTLTGYIQCSFKIIHKNQSRHLQVIVDDTGQGVPENRRNALFVQCSPSLNPTETTIVRSTGIGLSGVAMRLQMIGGNYGYTPRQPNGSSFWFDLPITFPSGEPLDKEEQLCPFHLSSPTPASSPKKNLLCSEKSKVLVVEDTATIRSLMVAILRRYDLHVTEAVDGEEGLEAASENDYALILSDINMPRLDGWSMCRQLRKIWSSQNRKHPLVIACTASIDISSLDTDFDAVLAKPVTSKDLKALITKYLDCIQPATSKV